MESFYDGAKDLMVVFSTHRTEFYYQLSSVKVLDGLIKGISGDTLFQCDNCRAIPIEIFFDKNRSKYLCKLPSNIMDEVNEALTHVRNIDEATLIRMLE